MLPFSRTLAFSLILNASLRLTTAQLSGTITSSQTDNEIIQVVITNESKDNVSILSWNNIFDTRALSKPFILKGCNGSHVSIGGSHIMSAGMNNDHLHDLVPGGNFTREFNLTDYIINLPGRLAKTELVNITLPSVYHGLVGHDGSYQIHPHADIRHNGNGTLISLGDFSKANLSTITLSSSSLQLHVSVPAGPQLRPTHPRSLNKRQKGTTGIQHQKDCPTVASTQAVYDALNDASYLAVAAQNALALPTFPGTSTAGPYPAFFGMDSPEHVAQARQVWTQLQQAADGHSSQTIALQCNDLAKACTSGTLGYETVVDAQAHIVVCPFGYNNLVRNTWPCTAPAGSETFGTGQTLGGLIVHEAMHVAAIAGFDAAPRDSSRTPETYGALDSFRLAARNGWPSAAANPSNWQYMASYAWDVGMGGNPWTGSACVDKFAVPTAEPGVEIGFTGWGWGG